MATLGETVRHSQKGEITTSRLDSGPLEHPFNDDYDLFVLCLHHGGLKNTSQVSIPWSQSVLNDERRTPKLSDRLSITSLHTGCHSSSQWVERLWKLASERLESISETVAVFSCPSTDEPMGRNVNRGPRLEHQVNCLGL